MRGKLRLEWPRGDGEDLWGDLRGFWFFVKVSPAADVGWLKTGSGACACVPAAPGASQHRSAPSAH